MQQTSNLHVRDTRPLIKPRALRQMLPVTEAACRTVVEAREMIRRVLQQSDPRMLVVVGPCSIHDVKAAREYAERNESGAAAPCWILGASLSARNWSNDHCRYSSYKLLSASMRAGMEPLMGLNASCSSFEPTVFKK